MAQTTQVLDLLLTARYVGGPAFSSIGRDIDALVNSTSSLAKVGAGLSLVGTAMTAAGVAVASFAVEAIKQYDQYNAAVNRLVAVHALAGNQLQQFNQIVMQTSDQFGQNSTDIAQGLYVIMSGMQALGYTAKDVFNNNLIQSLGAFVAASGNGQPGSVSWQTAATDILHIGSAFSLPMSQWPTLMGQMTAVENAAGITQNNLVQAMLRASSTGNELGMNPAELLATFGAMGTAGVFGPRAGTELASGLRLMLSNKSSLKELKSIGINPNSFWGANGQLLDPGTILASIMSHMATLSPQQRFAAESTIFGAVGNRALGQMMNPKVLATYTNLMNREVQNPVGNMFGVAGQQLNNFNGAVQRLHQAVLNLMKTVGGPLATALQPLITNLTNLVNKLTNFLQSPAGQSALAHAPQLLFGSAAGLLTAGPALQLGGGLLRDFALAQDAKHAKSLEQLAAYTARTDLGRSQLLANIGLQRQGLANRIALAAAGGGGRGGTALSEADQIAAMLRPRSAYWNELGTQRINALTPFLNMTRSGDISRRGPDPVLQRLIANATSATGPSAGLARRQAWDYVNAHWDTIASTYGVTGGPDPAALQQSMLRQQRTAGPNRTLANLQLQQRHFEEQAAQRLQQFDQTAGLHIPSTEPTAAEALRQRFGAIGQGIWGFGQRFSPYRLGAAGLHALWTQAQNASNRFALGYATHMGASSGGLFEPLRAVGSGLASMVSPITTRITEGVTTALRFGQRVAPNMAHGLITPFREAFAAGGEGMSIGQRIGTALRAAPRSLFQGMTGGFRDLWNGILNVARALPGLVTGFLSFGGALLPIIAVVLLVVGAITIGVLAFTKYRSQVMGVVAVFQSAFAPVFLMVEGVVLGVLKSIQTTWKQHATQIDAAMKQLMVAIGYAAPFFQQLGFLIGAVIAIIVKVIGYLVQAFISALPYIIGVFTSIFRFLGDLGNIITAVMHGNWGAAWAYAQQALADAWAVIKNLLMMLWTFISQVFVNLWKDISGPLGSLWNSITTWFSNLGTGIQNALVGALRNLGNALKNAISAPVQAAANAVVNGIPGLSLVTHGIAGFAGYAGGHASGGYIPFDQLSWVGEHGPELVRLPGGSQVYRHGDSMAMTHALSSNGSLKQLQLHIAQLQVHPANTETTPAQQQRSPAEEYFFARQIQREREEVWNRYPNTSRAFDHTYRRAYQYYG